jgi:hypothetical protein
MICITLPGVSHQMENFRIAPLLPFTKALVPGLETLSRARSRPSAPNTPSAWGSI